MKIAILTQPLEHNYGGLLQAWALQKTLVDIGHEVTIINRGCNRSCNRMPPWRSVISFIKNELYIVLGKRKRYVPVTDELKEYVEKYTGEFLKNRYKGITPYIKTDEQFEDYMVGTDFDAYIVGSDQVWRPVYSPNLMTYFLDFVKNNCNVKKIAYAASFGVDIWEFTKKQTREAARLAKLFDLITVRESSAVKLVKEHFGCQAHHVLDPTLLVNKNDYLALIENPTCELHESDGALFCYVLDRAQTVTSVIDKCSSITGYKPYFCNYTTPWNLLQDYGQKDECVVPPVEQWIKSFVDAKMVVTDSFHGTVFSIIFNKPFWVVANEGRGTARFKSLLEQFNLEDRIVSDSGKVDWNKPVDWDSLNRKLQMQKDYCRSLLLEYL